MKKVIVVGGGLGGIATALRLQSQGFNTTIIEKNNTLGGRLNTLQENGYRFDLGPSLIEWVEVFNELFSYVGKDMQSFLDFHRLPIAYKIYFKDGDSITVYADMQKLGKELEKYEKDASKKLEAFLEENRKKFEMLMNLVLTKEATLQMFLNPKLLFIAVRFGLLCSYTHDIKKYFSNPKIIDLLSFQNIYFGTDPDKDPAIYTILPYGEIALGVYYLQGGIYRIVETLETIAIKMGISILKNTEVTKINIKNGIITGILTKSGENIKSDIVVVNENIASASHDLIEENYQDYSDSYFKKASFSSSVITIYLGLKKTFPNAQHHMFFVAKTVKESIHDMQHKQTSTWDPSFYINIPSITDPTCAQKGHSAAFVLIPVPNIQYMKEWDISSLKKIVYDHIENDLKLSGFINSIEFESIMTPRDWKRKFNLYHGSTFGMSLQLNQLGPFRPACKSKKVDGLYFVGADMHPGSGLPPVLLSARITSDKILHETKR